MATNTKTQIVIKLKTQMVTKLKQLKLRQNFETQRGTMFRWTLKLKEVLNEQILSASVSEAAVLI